MSAAVKLTLTTTEKVDIGDALRRLIKVAELDTRPLTLLPTATLNIELRLAPDGEHQDTIGAVSTDIDTAATDDWDAWPLDHQHRVSR